MCPDYSTLVPSKKHFYRNEKYECYLRKIRVLNDLFLFPNSLTFWESQKQTFKTYPQTIGTIIILNKFSKSFSSINNSANSDSYLARMFHHISTQKHWFINYLLVNTACIKHMESILMPRCYSYMRRIKSLFIGYHDKDVAIMNGISE